MRQQTGAFNYRLSRWFKGIFWPLTLRMCPYTLQWGHSTSGPPNLANGGQELEEKNGRIGQACSLLCRLKVHGRKRHSWAWVLNCFCNSHQLKRNFFGQQILAGKNVPGSNGSLISCANTFTDRCKKKSRDIFEIHKALNIKNDYLIGHIGIHLLLCRLITLPILLFPASLDRMFL